MTEPKEKTHMNIGPIIFGLLVSLPLWALLLADVWKGLWR
jgi:hypothetical protein